MSTHVQTRTDFVSVSTDLAKFGEPLSEKQLDRMFRVHDLKDGTSCWYRALQSHRQVELLRTRLKELDFEPLDSDPDLFVQGELLVMVLGRSTLQGFKSRCKWPKNIQAVFELTSVLRRE